MPTTSSPPGFQVDPLLVQVGPLAGLGEGLVPGSEVIDIAELDRPHVRAVATTIEGLCWGWSLEV